MNALPTTTLTLKEADLLTLLESMESQFTDHMNEEQLAQFDKVYARLTKAFERIA